MPVCSALDADSVYFQHSASGEPMIFEGVDTLVLSQGHSPEDTLLEVIGARPS